MKKYINLLIYVSFIFVIIYLLKIDFIKFQNLEISWKFLILSTILLFSGFIVSGLSWWNALKKHDISVSRLMAIASHGLPVFTKYIPGKIWTIVGRAGYISEYRKVPMANTTFISIKEQLIYMWIGLFISIIPIFLYFGIDIITLLLLGVLTFLSLLLFSKRIHASIVRILSKIIKKEFNIPFISWKDFFSIQYYCLIYWFIWMVGYFFLVHSLLPSTSIYIAFIFPLSVVMGLLAIIIPGGLGVREGLMIAYFAFFNISTETAATIALVARMWFIAGEFFIFLFALLVNKRIKQKSLTRTLN